MSAYTMVRPVPLLGYVLGNGCVVISVGYLPFVISLDGNPFTAGFGTHIKRALSANSTLTSLS